MIGDLRNPDGFSSQAALDLTVTLLPHSRRKSVKIWTSYISVFFFLNQDKQPSKTLHAAGYFITESELLPQHYLIRAKGKIVVVLESCHFNLFLKIDISRVFLPLFLKIWPALGH